MNSFCYTIIMKGELMSVNLWIIVYIKEGKIVSYALQKFGKKPL